jgi:hypothetical protein
MQPEVPYANREIDDKFTNLLEHMKTFEEDTHATLAIIEAQTKKTNGYVADLIKWKYILTGFCGCISIVMLPLIWALIQAGRI